LYLFIDFYIANTPTFKNVLYGIRSEFIYLTDQPAMSLPNLQVLKANTCWDLLFYWSIYSTVLHMNGQSKMNIRLPDMTPYGMSLDVSLSQKRISKQ